MTHLSGDERSTYVRKMFTRIAHRYDLMNRLMTAGQDIAWRRLVIRRVALPAQGSLLDIGAGTGDLAREAKRQYPDCRVVASDFTPAMMRIGREHGTGSDVLWTAADAQQLPFPAAAFDGVVSGFLLRNVSDILGSLREQYRVLKPGGWMVALDTTRPPQNRLSPLINFHLNTVIPTLGRLITGEDEAYTYLPDSTAHFLEAENLAAAMLSAGFQAVGFQRLMFGTIAIHWGQR